jgi:PilZ domain
MASTRAMLERRRSSRLGVRVPVTVFRDGVLTPAVAVGVSRSGALIRLPFSPPVGSRLQVVNDVSQEKREFRVVRISELKHDGMFELGVEILYPSRNFWGIRFPDEFTKDAATASVDMEHQFPRA